MSLAEQRLPTGKGPLSKGWVHPKETSLVSSLLSNVRILMWPTRVFLAPISHVDLVFRRLGLWSFLCCEHVSGVSGAGSWAGRALGLASGLRGCVYWHFRGMSWFTCPGCYEVRLLQGRGWREPGSPTPGGRGRAGFGQVLLGLEHMLLLQVPFYKWIQFPSQSGELMSP